MYAYHIFILRSYAVHYCLFFFFNDTATTEIYTLSLHDALPIFKGERARSKDEDQDGGEEEEKCRITEEFVGIADRKSTRLNSSHRCISYAVFCLKKKKKKKNKT